MKTSNPVSATPLNKIVQQYHPLKKLIYYRKRRHTYFLTEIGEKDIKVSFFFFLIHPANSNLREISVLFLEFLGRLLHIVSDKTVGTTTDQRNLSVIERGKIYIFLHRKEKKSSLFYFLNPDNSSKTK